MRVMHTPGPWTTDGYFIEGPSGKSVSSEGASFFPEDLALVVTAPELLAACERGLSELTEAWPDSDWENTVDLLRAAIAKAKGESESAPNPERAEGASR